MRRGNTFCNVKYPLVYVLRLDKRHVLIDTKRLHKSTFTFFHLREYCLLACMDDGIDLPPPSITTPLPQNAPELFIWESASEQEKGRRRTHRK